MVRTLNTEISRIKRYLSNGKPNDDFAVSDNEIILYWQAATATEIKKISYEGYKIEGCLAMADGFDTTYKFTSVTDDADTGDAYVTLPEAPIGLPMGHSVKSVFIGGAGTRSNEFIMVKASQVPYFRNLPKPNGGFCWTEGTRLWLYPNIFLDDNEKLLVRMISVMNDRSAQINMPEDSIENVFMSVVAQLAKKLSIPIDIINDGIDLRK